MDPFFKEPDANAQPPENIRFTNFVVEPYKDGQRVKLHIEITPFQENPNIEIEIFGQDEKLVSSMSLVEIIENKFDLTLHLRDAILDTDFQIIALIFYTDLSHYEVKEDGEPANKGKPENKIVDKIEKQFKIQANNNK